MTTLLMAVNTAMVKAVLHEHGIAIENVAPWGPVGLALRTRGRHGRGSVIITQAEWEGEEWLHASIAWDDVMPDYGDLATLHRAVFGRRRYSYQVFAPSAAHVNIHEFALHLWGRSDGQPAMPDFGQHGTI